MAHTRIVALVMGAAVACGGGDGGTDPSPPNVSGSWSGPLAFGGTAPATVTATLTSTNGAVTGNSTIIVGTTSLPFAVAGSVSDASAFTLTFTGTSGTTQPFVYTGSVSGKTMSGAVNGSGFNNVAMTLTKQ